MEATAAATSLRRSTRSSIARSSLAPTEDSHGQSRQEMTPAPSVEEAGQASRATTAQRLLQTPPRRRSRLNDRFEVVWSDPRGKQNPGDDATTGGTVHTRSTIAGRGPMRTPVGLRQRKQSLNNADKDDEPDLPSTPSRSGNHSIGGTRVPGGLLNSPSLRSKKDKTSRGPSSLGRETTSVHPNESDSNLHPIEDEDLDLPDAEDHTETPPQAGQEETREQLLAELRELQEEVQHLENQVAAATSTRHQTIPKNKPRLEPIPFSFNAFLPFSRRRLNNKSTAPSSLPIPDHPPPSHHPIEVDDPLPYLQSFTPLTFSSTYESIPSAAGNASGRYQLHHIKVTSPGDLLTSRIRLTVDTTTHSIAALTIPGLSSWAESELGTWIRARAKDNSPAGKDITSICWAMGRYWVLAKRRAHYWMRCEREFKSLIISTSSHRSQRRRSGHQNGAEQGEDHDSIDEDEDDDDDDEEEIDEDRARTAKRQDLLRHLGRSSITFRQGRVQLLMGWHIGFDWTGEAHSEVSATASVPGSCKSCFPSHNPRPSLFSPLISIHKYIFMYMPALL